MNTQINVANYDTRTFFKLSYNYSIAFKTFSEFSNMSNRVVNYNLSLFGVAVTFLALVSLIFLIHKSHYKLEETRQKLVNSEEKLLEVSKQFESLFEYKNRLEKSFIKLKTDKASSLLSDQAATRELDELKELYLKQMETLQEDLKNCRLKSSGGVSNSQYGSDILPHIVFQNISTSPINRHITNYLRASSLSENKSTHENFLSKLKGNQNIIGSIQPSGDPNEDPAGNVFI